MVGRKKKDDTLSSDKAEVLNIATMERFIKRREKEKKKVDDEEDKDKDSDARGELRGRKKKAKFAFNVCDMSHDNVPVLSDDENIIMQLNVHSDDRYKEDRDVKEAKESKENQRQENTCFAQDASHECPMRRVHIENGTQVNIDMKDNCHLSMDIFSDSVNSNPHMSTAHPHIDSHSPSPSPSPYDLFENDFFEKNEVMNKDVKTGKNIEHQDKNDNQDHIHIQNENQNHNEIDNQNQERSHENGNSDEDLSKKIEILQKRRENDLEQICDAQNQNNNDESQDFKVIKLLKDFENKNKHNEWPITTHISCYWCCHKFFNAPFGIPVKYSDDKFHVFGCFCGLECALAYNLSMKDQTDEMWERCNLLNFLCLKTNYNKQGYIKPAPPRLSLKMFGGYLSIEEFRNFSNKNKVLNINFPPMQTITQQIEEINECDINNDLKYIPIDTDRINRYKEKMRLKRTKPLNDTRNTLDSAVNIKITTLS